MILQALLVIILSLAYGLTLAPGYTWANRAADAGDLITAAYTGGVAHPPGYPTYLLLARLFQYLPFGTLAFRTNLLSALCALLAALLVMHLTRRLSPGQARLQRWAGLIGGLAFGLSPLFWSQAVITEVYTLHLLFVASILWLLPVGQETRFFAQHPAGRKTWFPNRVWLDRLAGLVFGLALGNQLTVIFLLPVWLTVGVLKNGAREDAGGGGSKILRLSNDSIPARIAGVDWQVLLRRAGWLLLGLGIYLTIPLRARSGSPVNWGGADDWAGFWWLLSGRLYQGELFNLDWAELAGRLGTWAALLKDQFGWGGLALGVYGGLGLLRHRPRAVLTWVTLWVAAVYSVFAIFYAVDDYYVLWLPFYLVFALWLGMGAARLLGLIQAWRGWAVSLGVVLLLGLVGSNAAGHYAAVDASREREALTFAQSVLARVPQDGLLVTTQDEDTFVLWYYHYALGHRPDLILIHDGLLAYDWYRQAMLAYYPALELPPTGWDCLACAVKELPRLTQRPYCQIVADGSHALLCW